MTDSRRTRLVVGVVALFVVVVGSSSRRRLSLPLERSSVGRVLGDAGAIVFGVAGVVALVLLVVIAARLRRKRPEDERVDDQPHSRWARLAASLVALAVIVIPVVLIVAAPHRGPRETPTPPAVAPPAGSGRSKPPTVSHATPIAIAAVIVAVIVLLGVYWMWRAGRSGSAEPAPPFGIATMTPDDVAAATSSGAAAMHDFHDPRQAILACYAAMRAALIRLGLPAHAADTPTDFLLRATATGVPTSSTRELTVLFHEARFSAHPMTKSHRRRAEAALHEIARSISDRKPDRGGDVS